MAWKLLSLTKVRKPSKAVVLKSFFSIKWAGIDVLPLPFPQWEAGKMPSSEASESRKRAPWLRGLAPLTQLLSVNLCSNGKVGILQKINMDWSNGYGEQERNWKGYNWTDSPPIWPWNKRGANEIAKVKIYLY